jgi:hypothetical protein
MSTTTVDPASRIERLEQKLARRKAKVASTQAKLKEARQEAKQQQAAVRTGA